MRRMDFVFIIWRDAEARAEWAPDDNDPAPLIFTGGWVLQRPNKKNHRRWLLAGDIGEDAGDPESDKNRQMKVPQGMILQVERTAYCDGKMIWHLEVPEPLTASGRPYRRRAQRVRKDPSP